MLTKASLSFRGSGKIDGRIERRGPSVPRDGTCIEPFVPTLICPVGRRPSPVPGSRMGYITALRGKHPVAGSKMAFRVEENTQEISDSVNSP